MRCRACYAELRPSKSSQRTLTCEQCGEVHDLTAQPEATIVGASPAERSTTARPDLLIGVTIGDGCYRIDELIGEGGMGRVYRGEQLRLGRNVAIKVLHEGLADDGEFVRRFGREAKTLARLEHPNIVRVYDAGEEDGLFYIVMAMLAGPHGKAQTVRTVLDAHGELDADLAYRTMQQACAALAYAHEQGIVHRDIKPANFLLDQHDHLMLADFGIAVARHVGAEVTVTGVGTSMGSAGYMAPEQRRDAANVDGRADLYSLGVVLYEILVGERPDFSLMLEDDDFRWPSSIRPDVPAAIDEVIRKALRADPDNRFQTADEMWKAIDMARTHVPAPEPPTRVQRSPTRPAPMPTKVTSRKRNRLTPVLGVLALASVGMVTAAIMMNQTRDAAGSDARVAGDQPPPAPEVLATPDAGDPSAIRYWLAEEGAEVDARDEDGSTLLHLAVAAGRVDTVNVLIDAGADLALTDAGGRTALHIAAALGDALVLDRLLEAGAPVDIVDHAGRTALHSAVLGGSLACTKALVDAGADVTIADANGRLPIDCVRAGDPEEIALLLVGDGVHAAARNGDIDQLRRLLTSTPASVDRRNAEGNTPLLLACRACRVEAIEYLVIEQVAGVNIADDDGMTPLRSVLEGRCARESPATRNAMARLLVAQGAHADWVDAEGNTPIMRAVLDEDAELLRILAASQRMSVLTVNHAGMSPFCQAWLNWDRGDPERQEALDVLLANGAVPSCTDGGGNSMLHLTVLARDRDMLLELLLQGRLDANGTNNRGETPLHLAAIEGLFDIVELLVSRSDLLSVTREKNTPLHLAAINGHMQVVELLVDRGAALTMTNDGGRTPAAAARAAGHAGIAAFLDGKLQPRPVLSLANIGDLDGEWKARFSSPGGRSGSFVLRIESKDRRGPCILVGWDGTEHRGIAIINRTDQELIVRSLDPKFSVDGLSRALSMYEGSLAVRDRNTLVWTTDEADPLTVELSR